MGTEPDPDQVRLDALNARIAAAQKAATKIRDPNAFAGRAMGAGFRIATELVACVLVGAGLGWWLDKTLGTTPWLMILLLLLGAGAGLRNAWRVSEQAGEAISADLPPAPVVGFDDDEDDDWSKPVQPGGATDPGGNKGKGQD